MPANTSPIYTLTPTLNWAKVTGVDSSTDGTDADIVLVDTAGSNGHYIRSLICQPISTSGSTTTSAAALRVYLNNGSAVGTAGNNILFREFPLIAISVNTAATTSAFNYEVPLNFQMPSSYRLYVGVTAMAANTQWNILAVGGDY